ncbi:MAG TPA: glycosyltransferase family 2 protein [Ignavibacteriales bacterium]|nr:glycosyltransferase family 2 protein [Ignavibacteriales bacterium]
MYKIPVTIILPVKNEELNLPICLSKLAEFSQIIVVDSNSDDTSPAIAIDNNAEYYNFDWDGKFPKKRNWALRNIAIKNDWVLFLDADEYLTQEFIDELKEKIKNPDIDGYWVNYKNQFMGKTLKHGDVMTKLPLFRKGKGEYEKIDEDSWSSLDIEVHEHPIIEGNVGKIFSQIIHNDYKGLEHYIARHNSYSSWEAKRYMQLKKTGFKNFTTRQKIKYKLMNTGLLPFIYFISAYLVKLGFLDGKTGYYLAKYKAYYFFQIRTKIVELQQ